SGLKTALPPALGRRDQPTQIVGRLVPGAGRRTYPAGTRDRLAELGVPHPCAGDVAPVTFALQVAPRPWRPSPSPTAPSPPAGSPNGNSLPTRPSRSYLE